MKQVAIVLAGGQGTRMNSKENKQYMLLENHPVIYYALQVLQESVIDDIVLVVGKNQIPYCEKEIVDKYHFTKVIHIVEGGKERYHSVYEGIKSLEEPYDYIYIHDGARPFITVENIEKLQQNVIEHKACVLGMPVKDTIKIANDLGFAHSTPNRSLVWSVQTPQVFAGDLICKSYAQLIESEELLKQQGIQITDDAMVIEQFSEYSIKLVAGSYENIKITTPEDLIIAKAFLETSKSL